MKPSLEDERRALLEQIEASRAVYRRMLAGEPRTVGTPAHWRPAAGHAVGTPLRSRALQWAQTHPLEVAAGVALLVLLAPRLLGSSRRIAEHKASRRQALPVAPAPGGGTLRALLTVAALLLRDPARMRAVAAATGSAWRWLQQRRRTPLQAQAPYVATTARSGT